MKTGMCEENFQGIFSKETVGENCIMTSEED